MTVPDASWLRTQRVPATAQPVVTDVIEVTDSFCAAGIVHTVGSFATTPDSLAGR
jgi:hypothetical protein